MNNTTFLEKLLDLSADQARGAEACLSGRQVEWVALGEVAEIKRGTSITKNKVTPGDIPVIAGGRKPAYFHNTSNRNGQTIVISGSGAYAGFVSFWEQPVFVSDAFTVKPYHELLTRYCYHWLQGMQQKLHEMQSGGGIPHVYPRDIAPLKIPIPCPDNPEESLAIQAEIVRILDTFTELTAELTAELISELTARKKQFNYYRDQLLTFEEGDVEWKRLDTFATFSQGIQVGVSNQLPEKQENFVRFLRIVDFVKDDEIPRYIANPGQRYLKEEGELVMIRYGASAAGKVFLNHSGAIANNMFKINLTTDIVTTKFLYTYLSKPSIYNNLNSNGGTSTMPAITFGQIGAVNIPIPQLDEQARIVAILDKFDTLTNSISEGLPREIELRQKQYEYYRDLLLNFPKPEPQTEIVA